MNDKGKELFVVRATTAEADEYFITLGDKRASELTFKTSKEAQKYIESKPYELVMTMCFACLEAYDRCKEEANKAMQEITDKQLAKEG